MRKFLWATVFAAFAGLSCLPFAGPVDGGDKGPAFPGFKIQELETGLGVGYAVVIADVNNDGKPDIVVVDQTRVIWFENPTWKKRIIIEGGTKPDNVCIAAYDIDRDGQIDFALGAEWKPFNPVGTLRFIASVSWTLRRRAKPCSSRCRSWVAAPRPRITGWTAPRFA